MNVPVHFACTLAFLLCLGTGVMSRQIAFDSESGGQNPLLFVRAVEKFVCPEVGNYPVPGQECTNAYYSCGPDLTPVLSYCPGASVFEPTTQLCTSSSSAPCKKTTTSTTTTSTTLTESTSTTIQQITEEQSSTESTLTTPNSTTTATTATTVVTQKPTAESTFTTPKSTTTATTVTSARTTPFACPGTNGAFPNPTNCRTFYMCSNGIPYLYDCPSNLVFNAATGNCDYEVNVAGPCGSAR
ncbi:integumentary mucin C.1-like isoform X3 [Daphnia pulicaria]|uniref:integumentary mucin C.1-like isoform X3 n=1 Tax=Daphnia pulicaria TaxID=35523 RepID=UPI001EEC44F0|nr:integumentary mucin C.1-like isoform X3 [Daphnia pulicaria]